jgi:tRNA threonylcarbamoyladenosine biosynthesis protein TsaE
MTGRSLTVELPNAAAQEALGASLAACCEPPMLITLDGDLGAGKTTLVRGLVKALGHRGAVKSPTYTLIEPYRVGGKKIYHLDLYRLGDPEELEYIGLRDLSAEHALILVEWPQRGAGWLPPADLRIEIVVRDPGRRVTLDAGSARGAEVVAALVSDFQ